MKKLLTAIIVLAAFSSCSNYYKAIEAPQPANATAVTDLKTKDRFFILRNGTEAFSMSNISISPDQQTLQCTLQDLPDNHKLHLTKGRSGKMNYSKNNTGEDESAVLNEVHFYITPADHIAAGPYSLPLAKVTKTEILEKDKVKTAHSYTLGVFIGVTSAVLAVVGIGAIVASSISIF